MMLVVFDVFVSDKVDFEWLFCLLIQCFVFLIQGGVVLEMLNLCLLLFDFGIFGGYIVFDNFIIMLLVGYLLFDECFGFVLQMLKKLQKMMCFFNDLLDVVLCYGDVLLQICVNIQDMVIYVLCDIIKYMLDLFSVCWKWEGFIFDYVVCSKGKEMLINLLGFKDGIVNFDSQNDKLM